MTRFLDVVKRVAVAAVAAEKPVQLVFGTILTVSPFKVKLATQQELEKEFFLVLDPKPDWKPGDKLVLLRQQGGGIGHAKGADRAPHHKAQHHRGSRRDIAVCHNAETAQPHQALHLRDQVAHRLLHGLGRGLDQRRVAQQAVVAEAQMLGGLQRAKVIERAVLQRVQARIGQVALGVNEFFVIKIKAQSLCLLSPICWRSSSFARHSWLLTVAGGRPTSLAISAVSLCSRKYSTAILP